MRGFDILSFCLHSIPHLPLPSILLFLIVMNNTIPHPKLDKRERHPIEHRSARIRPHAQADLHQPLLRGKGSPEAYTSKKPAASVETVR